MEAMSMSLSEEKQVYAVNEFMEYMSFDDPLIDLSAETANYYVFCRSQEDNGHLPPPSPPLTSSSSSTWQAAMSSNQAENRERIKQWFHNLPWFTFGGDSILVQFWEPEIKNGGRRFLTTSWQPFALKTLYKGLSWYRKYCTNHDILVEEGADEEGLRPLGRVFLNGQPESSPDLRFYSIKEYPLRDCALRCGLRRYLALPVYELQRNYCLGVLELISFNSGDLPWMHVGMSRDAFKLFNLRILHMDSDPQTEGRKLALIEIKRMFKVVNETPNIPLALAWVPSQGCSGNCNCMEQACFACDPDWDVQYNFTENDFLLACKYHKLQQGKGVAGRALSSTHKLCFSRSICGFSITEYPLAHYTRKAMLTISFAICLQCAHTGSDQYVLEFFMRPGDKHDEDPRSLIHSLLRSMAQQLLSFKVASGKKWGEELLIEILKFRMDDEPAVYFQKSPSDTYPLGFIISAQESLAETEQRSPSVRSRTHPPLEIAGGNVDSNTQAGNNSAIVCTVRGGAEETTSSSGRRRKVTSSLISYEDIRSQFGKTQKEAATDLGVSYSTLKRECRKYGIERWSHNLGQKERSSPASNPSTCSNPSTRSITVQDTKLVTVKANYRSKTYKFQLCTSSGLANLQDQVAKRVKLNIGEFELSYEDEEGTAIFLSCDDDLIYIESLKTIQLSVTPLDLFYMLVVLIFSTCWLLGRNCHKLHRYSS